MNSVDRVPCAMGFTPAVAERRASLSEYVELELVGAPPRAFYTYFSTAPDKAAISDVNKKIEKVSGVWSTWMPRIQQGLRLAWLVLGVTALFVSFATPFGLPLLSCIVVLTLITLALISTAHEVAERRQAKEEITPMKVITIFLKYFGMPGLHLHNEWRKAQALRHSAEGLSVAAAHGEGAQLAAYLSQDRRFFAYAAPHMIDQLKRGESIYAEAIKRAHKEFVSTGAFFRHRLGPNTQHFLLYTWAAVQITGSVVGGPFWQLAMLGIVSTYLLIAAGVTAHDFCTKGSSWEEFFSATLHHFASPITEKELVSQHREQLERELKRLQHYEELLFPSNFETLAPDAQQAIRREREALISYLEKNLVINRDP